MHYPNNIKKTYQKPISYGNRGMDLEECINHSNEYYLENDIAVIHKKPTPIGVVDVAYIEGKKIIKKAYFKEPSTLDYNGLYQGKYIDFDAKETQNKTAFPISNVHTHQIEHMKKVIQHDGITFLIIKMNHEIYLLPGEDFTSFLEKETRKSIPYSYLKEKGHLIKEGFAPRLDYLKIIDMIYFKGE